MNGEKFRTLVVVPAFNEEESVAGVVEELRAYEPRWDVLVIDDGSSDRTAEMARRAGAKVVSLVRNLGIAGAGTMESLNSMQGAGNIADLLLKK